MPIPQKFARGDEMGRGPYEKSGIIADTGLHPGKKVKEHFEIRFPEGQTEMELKCSSGTCLTVARTATPSCGRKRSKR